MKCYRIIKNEQLEMDIRVRIKWYTLVSQIRVNLEIRGARKQILWFPSHDNLKIGNVIADANQVLEGDKRNKWGYQDT
jgi:hypothetical protein